jgi:hypothetical protein
MVMAKKDKPAGPRARNDAYVMMLFITLVAIVAGCVMMYLDNEEYGKTVPPKDVVYSPPKLGEAGTPPPAPGGGVPPGPGEGKEGKAPEVKDGETPKTDKMP